VRRPRSKSSSPNRTRFPPNPWRPAIKAYRSATRASVADARDAIEGRTAALRAAGREPVSLRLSPAERARFIAVLVMCFVFCAVFAFIIFGGFTLSHSTGTGHVAP
jgi:hypothetical protein